MTLKKEVTSSIGNLFLLLLKWTVTNVKCLFQERRNQWGQQRGRERNRVTTDPAERLFFPYNTYKQTLLLLCVDIFSLFQSQEVVFACFCQHGWNEKLATIKYINRELKLNWDGQNERSKLAKCLQMWECWRSFVTTQNYSLNNTTMFTKEW